MLTDTEIATQHVLVRLADDESVICYEKTNYKTSCNHSVCEYCTSRISNLMQCPYCRQIRMDICLTCRNICNFGLSCNHRICSNCPTAHPNLCDRCKPFRPKRFCIQCEGLCTCKILFCTICNELKTSCTHLCNCTNINFIFDSFKDFGITPDEQS